MPLRFLAAVLVLLAAPVLAQTARPLLLKPDRVFDGAAMHPGWSVLVECDRIVAAGPDPVVSGAAPADAETIPLPGATLLPGLIDSHVHLFLHPYDETSWNDQVLKEPLSLRVARLVAAAKATLDAGFTTVRDLGTEGAGDAREEELMVAWGLSPLAVLRIATNDNAAVLGLGTRIGSVRGDDRRPRRRRGRPVKRYRRAGKGAAGGHRRADREVTGAVT